jgi:hypothetical protein
MTLIQPEDFDGSANTPMITPFLGLAIAVEVSNIYISSVSKLGFSRKYQ